MVLISMLFALDILYFLINYFHCSTHCHYKNIMTKSTKPLGSISIPFVKKYFESIAAIITPKNTFRRMGLFSMAIFFNRLYSYLKS